MKTTKTGGVMRHQKTSGAVAAVAAGSENESINGLAVIWPDAFEGARVLIGEVLGWMRNELDFPFESWWETAEGETWQKRTQDGHLPGFWQDEHPFKLLAAMRPLLLGPLGEHLAVLDLASDLLVADDGGKRSEVERWQGMVSALVLLAMLREQREQHPTVRAWRERMATVALPGAVGELVAMAQSILRQNFTPCGEVVKGYQRKAAAA